MTQQYQVRFMQIPRWLVVVTGALAIAFAIALFLLSLTVFLLILPILAIAGAVYYLFGLSRAARNRRGRSGVDVIDAEYREIEQERIENERSRTPGS